MFNNLDVKHSLVLTRTVMKILSHSAILLEVVYFPSLCVDQYDDMVCQEVNNLK